MNISERAQEILEKYWIENKELHSGWEMEIVFDDPVAVELIDQGYARRRKERLELSKKGWDEARSCVRRHRLAECLLTDVLNINKKKMHEIGCEFEHVLQKEVEENICTLLGHPEKCPHGKPIPQGTCCRDSKRRPRKMIMPLSECDVKDRGKIAYIKADRTEVFDKLTSMGVLPGLSIRLIRKRPTYLFRMGESQFAIDRKLAEKIQIRVANK